MLAEGLLGFYVHIADTDAFAQISPFIVFSFQLSEIIQATQAIATGNVVDNRPVSHVFIDSRSVYRHATALFVCIGGGKTDRHAFIAPLYAAGVRAFVVQRIRGDEARQIAPDAAILEVEDCLLAFQQIAALKRKAFAGKVIGITGSNGKTIVKEWLKYLLSTQTNAWASPKSYNSQVGVPLSVMLADMEAGLWLLEAGISKPGEMQRLSQIIAPEIGIFTHLGDAHDEGFLSREEKLAEKCTLFSNCKTIFYPENEIEVADYLKQHFSESKLIGFSAENGIPHFPRLDSVARQNAAACAAFLEYFYPQMALEQWPLQSLPQVEMRMQVLSGANGRTIINDTYNADIDGLKTALQLARSRAGTGKVFAILGDFEQSGMSDAELYALIASRLVDTQVDGLIAIGSSVSRHLREAAPVVRTYLSISEVPDDIDSLIPANVTVLLKGSRNTGLDKLLPKLEESRHGTRLEVNLSAMQRNYERLKSILPQKTMVMAMVKAEAYGSGAYHVARLAADCGADYLAVAYVGEGVALRQAGIQLPIMVMNPAVDSWEQHWQYNLEPEVFAAHQLDELERFAAANPDKPLKVHVEIDTGMTRLGFFPAELSVVALRLNALDAIRVATIFSHLAAADEPENDAFTRQQADIFRQAADGFCALLRQDIKPIKHLLNSPGIIRHPQYAFDMVRMGIGLYGVGAGSKNNLGLEPVAALKTVISQVKRVESGTSVGYGRQGKLIDVSRIAVLDMGYADGLPRRLGRGAFKVKIANRFFPIIGNVCMDMTMVNLGEYEAKPGDEAIIFDDMETLNNLAASLDTIPYEILSALSARVKRVYWHE